MYGFPDFLVLFSLFTGGYFVGYYCKFAYIYDNPWMHWYAIVGIVAALLLGAVWTLKKHRQRQYQYEHFYVIFYGLICFIISSCFMITDNLDSSFYFGFIGLVTIYIPSFSYIALRCDTGSLRPMRMALGNAIFYAGLTTGFSIFNELEPVWSGWSYLAITLALLIGVVINELLQHFKVHDYKKSSDLALNLLNEEKLIFLNASTLLNSFVARPEYYFARNCQWLAVGLAYLLIVERTFLFSPTYLQLAWSSAFAQLSHQALYGPFLLYSLGGFCGAGLMCHYQPKVIYSMFALIKITALAAILGVYAEALPENCFPFLCFYYIAIGVYSSVALQMIAECTPFLLKEFMIALAFALEFAGLEVMKYELRADDAWSILLGIGVTAIAVSLLSAGCVQILLPRSNGLLDMRNKLIGVRRQAPERTQTNIWHTNNFFGQHFGEDKLKTVRFSGNRIFHQYPCDGDKTIGMF